MSEAERHMQLAWEAEQCAAEAERQGAPLSAVWRFRYKQGHHEMQAAYLAHQARLAKRASCDD